MYKKTAKMEHIKKPPKRFRAVPAYLKAEPAKGYYFPGPPPQRSASITMATTATARMIFRKTIFISLPPQVLSRRPAP